MEKMVDQSFFEDIFIGKFTAASTLKFKNIFFSKNSEKIVGVASFA
jgi:hypothetical protein